MNKNYISISADEIVVTDENGNMTIRKGKTDYIKNTLELENDLELINERIKDKSKILEYIQRDYKNINLRYIILVFLSLIALSCLFLFPFPLSLFTSGAVGFVTVVTGYDINGCKKLEKKLINSLKTELNKANEIQKDLESKLEKSRTESAEISVNLTEQVETTKVIKVSNASSLSDEISKALEEAAHEGMNQEAVKKLKLK